MSGYDYQVIPKNEAHAVQTNTISAVQKALKIADSLKYRIGVLQNDLEIEEGMIRRCEKSEVFTCISSLSDEVFSATRYACHELNAVSNNPPAIELRVDSESERKRYFRKVVLPQDQVISHLAENAIYVRTPMLWSRNNRRIRGNKGRTIGPEKCTVFRDSVYYSILLDPNYQQYDFSKYKRKIIHYLFVYRDLPTNRMYLIDNDNHETKHVTDAIVRFLPAGDTPLNCNFYSSALLTDLVPEGTYVTVTPMEDGVKPDDDIVRFWLGQLDSDVDITLQKPENEILY